MLSFIKQSMSLAAQSNAFEKFVSLLEHFDGRRSGLISTTPEAFDEQT